MQEQYRIYQRGGKNFYAKDTKTSRAFSLNTADESEAKRLVTAKNQSTEQPKALRTDLLVVGALDPQEVGGGLSLFRA
jgi:L-lactate utilization protein LutB